MTTAGEIMTPDTESMTTNATVQQAASLMASTGVGAVPVCEPDGYLTGMVTDRDIVVKVGWPLVSKSARWWRPPVHRRGSSS
jgi:CBS domain-containing protein